MAEIDDLKNSVLALQQAVTSVSNELSDVAAALIALKGQPVINPADVEAAAQTVSTLGSNLTAAVTAAQTGTGVS